MHVRDTLTSYLRICQGIVIETGSGVTLLEKGDRIVLPFVRKRKVDCRWRTDVELPRMLRMADVATVKKARQHSAPGKFRLSTQGVYSC